MERIPSPASFVLRDIEEHVLGAANRGQICHRPEGGGRETDKVHYERRLKGDEGAEGDGGGRNPWQGWMARCQMEEVWIKAGRQRR